MLAAPTQNVVHSDIPEMPRLYEALRIFIAVMTRLSFATVPVLRALLIAKSALLIPTRKRLLIKSETSSVPKGVGTIAVCASGPMYQLRLAELGLSLMLVASLIFVLKRTPNSLSRIPIGSLKTALSSKVAM